MSQRILRASCALALSLSLVACSGPTTSGTDTPTPTSSSSSSSGESAEHNAVDAMFVTMMIPHHEGAIEMSDVALARSSSPQIKNLAGRIKAAQGPEIEQMEGWLAEWGVPRPMTGPSQDMGHDMDHGSSTTGGSAGDDFGMGELMTMSDADLAALRAASGVAFDRLFLQQMIAHHHGAIEMADVEIGQGRYPQTLALAGAIKADQTAEIAEMQRLLSAL